MNYGEALNLFMEILCRFLLWAIFMYFEKQEPFTRHIEEEELWMYRFPIVKSYIQGKYLWPLLTIIPATVFIIEYILNVNNDTKVEAVKNDIAALTLAYPINGVITSMLKMIIGRPRPNFFFLCFPDGYGTSLLNCTGDYQHYVDGRKSFPSGHSSFGATSMTYLALNLARELNLKKTHNGKSWKIVFTALPLVFMLVVAVSRTCDYHHHYSDVIGGMILGSSIASMVYWLYRIDNVVE